MSVLSVAQVDEAGLHDWVLLRSALHTRLRTSSWALGMRLLTAISEMAEEADHHPDVDLKYGHLDIHLASHDVGGVTGRDIRLARRISALIGAEFAGEGVTAVPDELSVVEVALDTPDAPAVRGFWDAVLGGRGSDEPDAVNDDTGRTPSLWFQSSGRDEPRQRFHLDVTVPVSRARERIAAAVAAGGRIVNEADAPRFVVLADPDGNHACICTMEGR